MLCCCRPPISLFLPHSSISFPQNGSSITRQVVQYRNGVILSLITQPDTTTLNNKIFTSKNDLILLWESEFVEPEDINPSTPHSTMLCCRSLSLFLSCHTSLAFSPHDNSIAWQVVQNGFWSGGREEGREVIITNSFATPPHGLLGHLASLVVSKKVLW